MIRRFFFLFRDGQPVHLDLTSAKVADIAVADQLAREAAVVRDPPTSATALPRSDAEVSRDTKPFQQGLGADVAVVQQPTECFFVFASEFSHLFFETEVIMRPCCSS